jgi:hypothetical protein
MTEYWHLKQKRAKEKDDNEAFNLKNSILPSLKSHVGVVMNLLPYELEELSKSVLSYSFIL